MNKNKVITGSKSVMKFRYSLLAVLLMVGLGFAVTAPSPAQAQNSCDTTSSFGTITQRVQAPVSATYTAWVRLWVPSGSANSVRLSVNTICDDLPGASSVGAGSWVWVNKAADNSTLQTSLTENSTYTLVVSGQAAGVRVDRVMLLSDNCTPSGTGDNCTTVDTTAPTIDITQPAHGQTVTGNVGVQFDISDPADTSKVELLVNGTAVASSTTSDFGITWDSRSVTDGAHTLRARLTDKDGNTSQSDTVSINVANVIDGSDTSRIPADAYNAGGEGVGYHDNTTGNEGSGTCRDDDVDLKAGTTNCIIGWFQTGEWLAYDVNVSVAGTYTFQLNASSGDSAGGQFNLDVDGQDVTGTTTVPSTGSFDSFTIVSKTIELPAGSHTLRLNNLDEYFDVAWLQFVGPGTVSLGEIDTPDPVDDVQSRIYMDNYNAGGEGVGYHDESPGNLGSGNCRNDDVDLKPSDNGCIVGWFQTGEWLAYDVNIATAGIYTFQLNAARGESGDGAFRLEVDGNNVSGRVNVPSTGDWDTFSVINTEIDLPEGEHTLRFFNEQQYFDAEWMNFTGPGTVTLTSTPPGPDPEDTTPPSQPTGLQATNVTTNSVSLTWNESVDSGVGVVGYAIYRDGVLLQAVPSVGFSDSNLNSNSDYNYQVSALDAVGNESTKASLNVKTEAEPAPPSDGPSADLNEDGVYNVSDLSIFKSLYKSGSSEADFNGDGELTVQDWALFLAAWKEGR